MSLTRIGVIHQAYADQVETAPSRFYDRAAYAEWAARAQAWGTASMIAVPRMGRLAKQAGYRLPLQVLRSANGFYLGTVGEDGPVSRESVEYWPAQSLAEKALAGDEGVNWTQRQDF